jgi:hypothetical protein
LARLISAEDLGAMGDKLTRRHMPKRIDFNRHHSMESNAVKGAPIGDSDEQCASCHKRITARVVRYCYDNHELFAGKAYCFDCQKGIAFQAVM